MWDQLLAWLRSKGVNDRTPFHFQRKLNGSELNDRHGIHAASIGLRHSNIRTTSEFYVDSRARLTAGFGSVLSERQKVTPLPKPASDHSAAV
jgi:hypothetical protein